MTAMAVTVVPMPRWAGLRIAARKMSLLAVAIESTNSAAVGSADTALVVRSASPSAGAAEAMSSSRWRIPSTAIWLATSPASCPPMPSATTNAVVVTRKLSSFSGRMRPVSVAAPTRSSATIGSTLWSDRACPHRRVRDGWDRHEVRHCASINVVPTCRRSPWCSNLAPISFTPLWYVPLVEPRSSTIGWPS